jgi:dTMP kinase
VSPRRAKRKGTGGRGGPGRFIVLEGLDGAGTTTQARILGDALRRAGRRVHVTAEPSIGPAGALVRQILTRRVAGPDGAGFDPTALALLFAADRLDHVAAEITPKVREGMDVISDRFTLSSLAYQGLTTGDMAWVEAINGRAAVPDVTVFLRVPATVAFRRRKAVTADREIFEVSAFQRQVADSYDRAMAYLRAGGQRIVEVDGEAPIEKVAAAVLAEVERIR